MSESRANGDWPLEDIAGFVLEEARRSGATAADVVIAEGDALSTAVRLGEVEKLQRARGKHLGLRVFVDQRSAVTSSADFSRDALKNLASETCALARLVEADECGGLPEPADLAGAVPDLDLFHPKEVSAEDGLELARRAEAAALGVDPRITNSEGAEFSCDTRHAVYASTLGFTGGYRSSTFGLSAVPVATDNGQMQRDYWYSAKRVFSELEDPEEIGRRAAQRTLRRIGGRKISTQQVPVIFEAEVASSLLRHLAGDRFEVYSAGTRPRVVRPEAIRVGEGTRNRYRRAPFQIRGRVCRSEFRVCHYGLRQCAQLVSRISRRGETHPREL